MADKAEKPPIWVRWYAKDALDGTQMLSPTEELAYRRVLDMIYATGNQLLDDDRALAWATKAGRQWSKVKAKLIQLGKLSVEGGMLRNKRATHECSESSDFIAQRSKAGAASSEARKALKTGKTHATAVGAPVDTAVPTGVPTNHSTPQEETESPSPLTDSVPDGDAAPQQKRRAILGRLPSAKQWWPWQDCESEPMGPSATKRPCIRPRDGVCTERQQFDQTYPLDGDDGLPNTVFTETLVKYDNVACTEPIDWTPLLDWVHDGIPAEIILAGVKAANETHRKKG